MTSPAGRIVRAATLTRRDADQVEHLAARVENIDGAPPLDEQATLRLTRTAELVEHVLLRADDAKLTANAELIGYAQVERTDPAAAEIVVGVQGSRPAIAAALFDAAEALAGPGELMVWARGDASPVRAEAEKRGYLEARGLLTMAATLADLDTEAAPLPTGVTIRAFVPGQDDAAWLRVNAAAFATHAEQGRWTQADLDDRIAQDWFDPAGFLLAVQDGRLLGFHWTKLHAGHPPIAEVYVIAMDPSAQGLGLGRTLLLRGLRHLQTTGAETVILYTDEENTGAVRLYERSGFAVTRRQTQYRRGPSGGADVQGQET
jgi:mycothiol synthase